MISARGARWRRYEPTPLIKPPPPVAMNTGIEVGQLAHELDADGALPRHDVRVIVR